MSGNGTANVHGNGDGNGNSQGNGYRNGKENGHSNGDGLTPRDRKLLTLLQEGFPLCARPFAAIGRHLDLTEEEVLERVREFKRRRLIRRLGGVFDTRGLGYASSLVAMRVPPARLEEVGALVSEYDGVTHNYARDGSYNLWFTLIAPSPRELDRLLAEICHRSGVDDILNLPAEKVFKVEASFDLTQE